MFECSLDHKEFEQRLSYDSCSIISIISCTFSDIHNEQEGAALSISSNGHLEVDGTKFSHCSTTSIVGALSCTVSGVEMEYTCFYDCSSSTTPSDGLNVMHAISVHGSESQNIVEICQCGFALCPKDHYPNDETIGIRDRCAVTFKENNLTENLEREEMFTVNTESSIAGSMIHCNLHKCNSGVMLLFSKEAIIEKCNIIDNKPAGVRHELILNEGNTTLANCVIAGNTHSGIFYLDGSNEIISCFFCNNAFIHDGDEVCVPTLKLDLRDADLCKRGSFYFSKKAESLAFIQLSLHFLLA